MKLLANLERRYGRHAPRGAVQALAIAQAAVFVSELTDLPGGAAPLRELLQLVPARVLRGEWWRLFTFPVVPPISGGFGIASLLYLWAFYYFGAFVEEVWGAFRVSLYLLVGFALAAAASFASPETAVNGGFVKTSIFLAFAALAPDLSVALYGVLPVPAKWLAAIVLAGFAQVFYRGALGDRLLIAAALANYLLFCGPILLGSLQRGFRRRRFRRGVRPPSMIHKCHACDRDSQNSPRTLFRYCSKCVGQVCYCPDHLQDHEHVGAAAAPSADDR